MIIITNLDDDYYELREEFQKLALLVPIIPEDRYLSELEFIEFVIDYIRQLQQLLSYIQCNKKLTPSMETSIRSSSPHLFNQLKLRSSNIQTNERSSTIHRSPLRTINLDNINKFNI